MEMSSEGIKVLFEVKDQQAEILLKLTSLETQNATLVSELEEHKRDRDRVRNLEEAHRATNTAVESIKEELKGIKGKVTKFLAGALLIIQGLLELVKYGFTSNN